MAVVATSSLTRQESEFLNSHDVPSTALFDAAGLSPQERRTRMEELGLYLYFNGTPCAKANHRLKNRNGNCVQCDPAAIGFLKGYLAPGVVYVATSNSSGLVKVGRATGPVRDRERSLNEQAYASVTDWRIAFHKDLPRAGPVEAEIQRHLREYRVRRVTTKSGRSQRTQEVFKCSPEIAIRLARRLCR